MSVHEITFRDGDFPHRSAWCWSRFEGRHRRWIAYGMPRLNPHFSDAVFLLYGHATEDDAAEKFVGPVGSGVIIRVIDHSNVPHLYGVTAAHVVAGGGSVVMVNSKTGSRRPIEFDPCEWTYKLEREDLAIVDITDGIRTDDQIACIPLQMFATEKYISYVELGIGEDGFMLGLFSGKKQGERNEIAARFGNISLLADPSSPVSHTVIKNRKDIRDIVVSSPCHIFDMHSRPGFSGSPVFVYRTLDGDLRNLEARTSTKRVRIPRSESEREPERGYDEEIDLIELDYEHNRFLKLLGIHVSQFQERVEIKKGPPPSVEAEAETPEDDVLRSGDLMRFPGSMTVVVPVERILELLEDKDLITQRKDRTDRVLNAPETEADLTVPEKTTRVEPEDSNPRHREDFTSLLGAAAKKKPQADRT